MNSLNSPRDNPTASPCVGRCSHSTGDVICRGCGRTVDEVRDWNRYDNVTKVRVKRLAKARLSNEEEECF